VGSPFHSYLIHSALLGRKRLCCLCHSSVLRVRMSLEEFIEVKHGAGGDSKVIKGTRIRVSAIAQMYSICLDEIIAERIHQDFPHLTLEGIFAAFEYWRANTAEIEAEIQEEIEMEEKMAPH